MVDDEKTRVVIISHPDFNKTGQDGILEAKSYGELIEQLNMNPNILKAGLGEEEFVQLTEHMSKYRIYVRKIPKDLL